jgi:hypothetical protein
VVLDAQVVANRRYPVLGPRKIIAAGLLLTGVGITALVAIGRPRACGGRGSSWSLAAVQGSA